MTTEQFAYWLQGFVEINGSAPSEEQWLVVKDHLQEVFKKVTPDRINYISGGFEYNNPPKTIPCVGTITCATSVDKGSGFIC